MFGVACKLNHTWRTIRHGPYMIRSSCTPLRSIPLLAQTRKGTFALFRPVLDSLHHGKTHTDHAPELGQHSAADDKPNCQGQRRRAWQPRINEKRPLKKELTERIVRPADGHGAPRHDTTCLAAYGSALPRGLAKIFFRFLLMASCPGRSSGTLPRDHQSDHLERR